MPVAADEDKLGLEEVSREIWRELAGRSVVAGRGRHKTLHGVPDLPGEVFRRQWLLCGGQELAW